MSTPVCWDDIDALLWASIQAKSPTSTAAPRGAWDWTVCGNANCVTDEECTGVASLRVADTPLSGSHGAVQHGRHHARIGWFDTADPDGTFAHLGNGNGGVPDSGRVGVHRIRRARVRIRSDAVRTIRFAPNFGPTWLRTSTDVEPAISVDLNAAGKGYTRPGHDGNLSRSDCPPRAWRRDGFSFRVNAMMREDRPCRVTAPTAPWWLSTPQRRQVASADWWLSWFNGAVDARVDQSLRGRHEFVFRAAGTAGGSRLTCSTPQRSRRHPVPVAHHQRGLCPGPVHHGHRGTAAAQSCLSALAGLRHGR